MNEIFIDIKGYEGIYQVSNLGRIRNSRGKILKPNKDHKGYMLIYLYKDGKRKTHKVHRLVAIAFIPNPENKKTVNHKDEVKTNNHVDNLEWMTTAENNSYGTRTERAASAKKIKIKCIELDKIFDSAADAARWLGIDNGRSNITKCCKGQYKYAYNYHWQYVEE